MIKKDFIIVDKKTFDEWYKLVENTVYNLLIAKTFCEYNNDSEDCISMKPIIQHTHKEIDLLYAMLIDIKYSE